MLSVVIESSRIRIFPYELGYSKTLEKRLSIWDLNTHSYTERLFLYDLENKTLYVPKGFGVSDIKFSFKEDYILDYEIMDKSNDYIKVREINKIVMRPEIVVRDEHQKKSIEFLTDYINIPNTQKMLNLTTGYGKTFVSIKVISELKMPSLIIVDTQGLMDQWYKVILQYTYTKPSDIIKIQGRDSIEKLMKNKPKEIFYIASLATLDIYAKEGLLESFEKYIGFGIKIVDEAHKMYIANCHIDLMSNIMNNFYLTATPERSDLIESEMYNRITKNIPKFGSYTADLNKYVHVKNVYINTQPSPWEERVCHARTGFHALKYESFIFKNEKKKNYILLVLKRIIDKAITTMDNDKILVLLARNDDIDITKDYFEAFYKDKIGVFNSKVTKKEKRAEQLQKQIILSTVQSSGAGLDIKDLRSVIVFMPFKSFVTLHQLFGRLRYIKDKAVFYFNIIDEGWHDCIRQANIRLNYLKKRASSIQNIEIPMEDSINDQEIVF
jgi:superfamily II DNA or RNA helicase